MELATDSIKSRLQEALNEGDNSRMVGAWDIISKDDDTIILRTNGVLYRCLLENNQVLSVECVF